METNEENVVELRKIPLEGFIETLQDIYNRGADYIDIVAKPNVNQDVISIIIKPEYIDPENNFFEEDLSIYPKDVPLSNFDLNSLI